VAWGFGLRVREWGSHIHRRGWILSLRVRKEIGHVRIEDEANGIRDRVIAMTLAGFDKGFRAMADSYFANARVGPPSRRISLEGLF